MGRVVIPGFRKIETSGGGEGGTTNYNDLANKPSINNVPLVGNLNTVDLKLTDATLTEEGVPAEAKTVGHKLEEHSTSLTALSEQLGNHTVKSDVPENAVFTDTVYDYSSLLGYDIYNLVSLKDATYPANKTWLSIDFIAPFDGYIFFMVQTDATSGAFTQVFREDDVLVSNNQKNIADFNTWGEAYRHQIYKGKTYHFGSYTNTATAFNKVMLCISKKLETPTQYVPYAPSNVELAEEKADKSETTVNLLNPTLQTTTLNGVTCTNNGDGTYTLNGTASAHTSFSLTLYNDIKGKFKVVGCPKNGSNTTYNILVIISDKSSGTWKSYEEEYGSGIIFENYDDNYVFSVDMRVVKGTTVSNLVFKPMLTTNLNATYDDFVPYTGDSGSLNGDVAGLKNDLDKLNSLPIGSIIQIEAAKDDIEKTTQKYGWQYLGTSNIEYDRGSATLLVTNVYRKNE